jgi:N-acyl-phosphatidylethanolamine-hydrolysing phospholipase D
MFSSRTNSLLSRTSLPYKRLLRPVLLKKNYVSWSLSDLLDDEDEGLEGLHSGDNDQLPRALHVRGRYVGPWSKKSGKSSWAVLKWLCLGDPEKDLLKDRFQKISPPGINDTRDLIKPVKEIDWSRITNSGGNSGSGSVNSKSSCNGSGGGSGSNNNNDDVHVTWIGHATCLIKMAGLNIITDPMFSQYASSVQGIGPRRFIDPAIALDKLPKLDIVLLSHTHYDHLDANSAKRIGNQPLWVVPLGIGKSLAKFGVTNVVELDWWQQCKMMVEQSDGSEVPLEVTLTPAKHWTARSPFDRNVGLWGSFVLRDPLLDTRVFFGGDSAYCNIFKSIGTKYGPFDMALVPIGAYKPRWFMKDVHCSPNEAVQIHKDLNAKQTLGIHWGTFHLADEDHIEPALELAKARQKNGLTSKDIFTLQQGETLIFGDKSQGDFATLYPTIFDKYLELSKHDKEEEPSDDFEHPSSLSSSSSSSSSDINNSVTAGDADTDTDTLPSPSSSSSPSPSPSPLSSSSPSPSSSSSSSRNISSTGSENDNVPFSDHSFQMYNSPMMNESRQKANQQVSPQNNNTSFCSNSNSITPNKQHTDDEKKVQFVQK